MEKDTLTIDGHTYELVEVPGKTFIKRSDIEKIDNKQEVLPASVYNSIKFDEKWYGYYELLTNQNESTNSIQKDN